MTCQGNDNTMDRMERYKRNAKKTEELSTFEFDTGLTLPCSMSNAVAIVTRGEKRVATQILRLGKSRYFAESNL
jgi:hypothetical protein